MRELLLATTMLAAVAALPLSGAAAAGKSQMQSNPATQTQSGAVQHDWDSTRAFTQEDYEALEGKSVQNLNGREIGEVEKIVTDVDGQKHYAVIAVGGTLGLGEKQVAVPIEELRRDGQSGDLVVMSRTYETQLRDAPEYDERRYPDYTVPGNPAPPLHKTPPKN